MVRKQLILLVLICAFGLVACATIITGKKQSIHFISVPESATITILDSQVLGITPCMIKLTRPLSVKDSLFLLVSKPNYESKLLYLKPKFNEASTLNFIFPWNWMIDAIEGGILRFQIPDTILLKEIKKTP